ncbi:hypothetical protein HanIR_Chr09g0446631 [Helianthus annuus]|nr:hypothetical protein HanIR_Chr09g0446631 [Helianthus annuus]
MCFTILMLIDDSVLKTKTIGCVEDEDTDSVSSYLLDVKTQCQEICLLLKHSVKNPPAICLLLKHSVKKPSAICLLLKHSVKKSACC